MAEITKAKQAPKKATFSADKYAEITTTTLEVIEVANIAQFDVPLSQEGNEFTGKLSSDPEILFWDKKIGSEGNQRDGRVILITATFRTDKGRKISFSMDAQQAAGLKKGDSVTVVAVKAVNADRCRLNML
jgi:hypothetical protein